MGIETRGVAPDWEQRSFTATFELREDPAGPVIAGHMAVFNELSQNLGGFFERIQPGAFAESLQKDDVRALFNHDPNFVLGRNRSGTLTLSEDERGLAVLIKAPQNQTIRDLVLEPLRRGDITQGSFGFAVRTGGQEWTDDEEGRVIRTLKSVRLFDVSPVTFPAYLGTDVAARSLAEWRSAGTAAKTEAVGCHCQRFLGALSRIEDRIALIEAHQLHRRG